MNWVLLGFDDIGRLVRTQGWWTFARAQKLAQDQILHFRYNGENTFFVKVFGYLGGRVECCSEGSGEDGNSSDDEEEDGEDSFSVKEEARDSFPW